MRALHRFGRHAREVGDRPQEPLVARHMVEDTGQTLLPAEVTTAKEPAGVPFSGLNAPKEEEEAIDVNSVFAKLKQLKSGE